MQELRSISDEYAISFDTLLKDDVAYISHIDKTNDKAIKATRWLKIVVPVAIVLLVITAAVAVHQSKRGTYESSALPGIEDKDYVYPKNENGQTYGPDWMGAGEGYEEHAPDLIAASGVNGKQGYVKRTDLDNLDGSPVSTPEEADEYMERKNQRNGKNYYIVIPVFAEDGVTEIDQFWIYNGTGKYGPGSKGDTAIVPDLTGMTKDDAVAALKEVGLVLGNITYVISDNEKGVVENQDPPAGTNLGSGSSIDIGKYASSVLDSPSFFNPKWCNASYPDSRWKKEVDSIFENAKDSIEYILETGQDDVGIILGYYFDKLSLEGLDAFLNNVRKEEPKRQPETIFIDVNTGEILEQPEEQPAEETPSFTEPQINIVPESDIEEVDSEEDNADVKSQQPDEHSAEIEPVEVKVHRQVMLFGTKEQINKYLAAAPQFDVTVDDV